MISFNEESYSHAIIDDIVVNNAHLNPKVFAEARDYPPYYGYTSVAETKTKLVSVPNKKNITALSFIADILLIYNSLKFEGDIKPQVVYVVDDKPVDSWITSEKLIRLIKACSASSYSPCKDYSDVVSAFTTSLLGCRGKICLPLYTPRDTKLQRVISDELHELLKSILEEENISYSTELVQKEVKSSVDMLVKAARTASGE